jgi:hypothetical protein
MTQIIEDVRLLQSLQLKQQKGDKQTVQLTATEDFLIIAKDKFPNFGALLADQTSWPKLNNNKLPQINDRVTLNGIRFYVTARDLSHYKDHERAIRMTVRYDSKTEDNDEQPPPPNNTDPETWQRITIQSQQMTEPALGWTTFNATIGRDQVGGGQDKPRNSAGDPVDGLEEDTALVKLSYTNTQVVAPDFVKLQDYTNKCNDGPFLGGMEYDVRCVGWSGEYDQKNNVWSITVEFLYKPNKWRIEFYDVGFNEIVDGERRAILDVRGNPVSKPVPLDGNGRAAPIGNGGGGGSAENFQPVNLFLRYLFPYPSTNLNNIWNDCRI